MPQPLWIILPGLPLPVEDYSALAALLPGEVRVLDTLRVVVTGRSALIRAEVGTLDRPATLIGHSVGGLAALDWVLSDPTNIARVVLLDTSLPKASVPPRLLPGGAVHRIVRVLLGAAVSVPAIARSLARRGRRAVREMYGAFPDTLGAADVERIFGSRAALLAVWDQLCERLVLQRRVRALLDIPGAVPRGIPILQVIATGSAVAPVPAADLAAGRALGAELGSRLVEVPLGHLFPQTHASVAAGIIIAGDTSAG